MAKAEVIWEEMKSSLRNMILSLGVISLAAAAGLGYVHGLTKEPIARVHALKTIEGLRGVLPPFEDEPVVDTVVVDEIPVVRYAVSSGRAVQTVTQRGYSGEITLMVGFLPSGEVHNIVVLQQSETPGLGSNMTVEDNPLVVSFRGKNPADMKLAVRKEGGDVDALTASTVSSRAYIDAVERAVKALEL